MKRIMVAICLVLFCTAAYPQEKLIFPYPFKINETLRFTISALGVQAVELTIQTLSYSTYQNQRIIIASYVVKSTATASVVYNLFNTEKIYFLPADLRPVYNEKIINEGGWHDRMYYSFYPNRIEYINKNDNYKTKVISHPAIKVNHFYTLIFSIRSLDFNYYLNNKISPKIAYLFKDSVIQGNFRIRKTTAMYKSKVYPAFAVEEIGGMNFSAVILDMPDRLPIKVVIPALPTPEKNIMFEGTLIDHTPGNLVISK